jgi:hypothetical protein
MKEIVMGQTCSSDEMRNAHEMLVGKTLGNSSLGRVRKRWKNNI